MYIDPGMGSLCFQALAAFLIGIGVFFGKAKLVLFWKKKKEKSIEVFLLNFRVNRDTMWKQRCWFQTELKNQYRA